MKRPPGRPTATVAGVPSASRSSETGLPSGSVHRVALLLPAVARQRLPEVAGAVEQADADDRHAEVAGRLEVVAGEDAQAAGVLRQRGGDAVLGREVGDAARAPRRPGDWNQRSDVRYSRRSSRRRFAQSTKPGSADSSASRSAETSPSRRTGSWPPASHRSGSIAANRSRVARVPGPAQVDRQLLERGEVLGQDGADGESADGSHAAHR